MREEYKCVVWCYLSLIGKAVRADDAFVVLDRGFGIAWFTFAAEVDVVETEPLGETLVPLKVIQKRPGCVSLHIHAIFNRCEKGICQMQVSD